MLPMVTSIGPVSFAENGSALEGSEPMKPYQSQVAEKRLTRAAAIDATRYQ